MDYKKEKQIYLVYKHTNKVNGKVYVGQTSQNPERRWRNEGNGYKKSPYFYNAIQKYGWNNFEHKILLKGLTKDEADLLEKYLIEKWELLDQNKGYNLKEGGSNGKHSEETRKKISKSHEGIKNYNYGKHHTEETKIKMSNAQKGSKNHQAKKIIRIYDNKLYNCIEECSKDNNINRRSITNHCQNKVKKPKYKYA